MCRQRVPEQKNTLLMNWITPRIRHIPLAETLLVEKEVATASFLFFYRANEEQVNGKNVRL